MAGCFTVSCTSATASSLLHSGQGGQGGQTRVGRPGQITRRHSRQVRAGACAWGCGAVQRRGRHRRCSVLRRQLRRTSVEPRRQARL